MITARFSSNHLLWLDEAYDRMFPDRRRFWRHPWLCAEDIVSRGSVLTDTVGIELGIKTLVSILKDVLFPDPVRGETCRKKVAELLGTLLDFPKDRFFESGTLEHLLEAVKHTQKLDELRIIICTKPPP